MRRTLFLIILVVSLFIIQSLVRSIYTLWQKHDLLVEAEQELQEQKKENAKFKQQLVVVESQNFTEKEARNKLFLQKPGEQRVLIDARLVQAVSDGKIEANGGKALPNWQQWINLFF